MHVYLRRRNVAAQVAEDFKKRYPSYGGTQKEKKEAWEGWCGVGVVGGVGGVRMEGAV